MSNGGERNDEAEKLDVVGHRIALVNRRVFFSYSKPTF